MLDKQQAFAKKREPHNNRFDRVSASQIVWDERLTGLSSIRTGANHLEGLAEPALVLGRCRLNWNYSLVSSGAV